MRATLTKAFITNKKEVKKMKKLINTAIVILSISLALVIIGSVLAGMTWGNGFNGAELAAALVNIGYISAALTGIVLTGLGVSYAVRNEDSKK